MTAPTGPHAWRLIVDGRRDAAWNMAVDEALLDARAAGPQDAPPVLRLYGWAPPALSLGRTQPPDFDRDYLQQQHIDLVRRPTGGRAVLHEHERTYAVVGGLRSACFPGGVVDTYRRVAAALAAGLRGLGLEPAELTDTADAPVAAGSTPACFHTTSTHEIAVAGSKLLGSAQLRRRGAFLQHGSLPIAFDAERTARALGAEPAGGATDLVATLGRKPDDDEIDAALVDGFRTAFGARFVAGALAEDEHLRAAQLYSWKYSSLAWTLDGRSGDRERRWGPL